MDLQMAHTEMSTWADGSVLIFKNVSVESDTIPAPSEKVISFEATSLQSLTSLQEFNGFETVFEDDLMPK
jgi:hypothetical protein